MFFRQSLLLSAKQKYTLGLEPNTKNALVFVYLFS